LIVSKLNAYQDTYLFCLWSPIFLLILSSIIDQLITKIVPKLHSSICDHLILFKVCQADWNILIVKVFNLKLNQAIINGGKMCNMRLGNINWDSRLKSLLIMRLGYISWDSRLKSVLIQIMTSWLNKHADTSTCTYYGIYNQIMIKYI
jgi:hypothetical protein